jgi:hypothetical protein
MAMRILGQRGGFAKYVATGALVLVIGGTGSAVAASGTIAMSQLVQQTSTGVNVAHVDSAGNVAVNDAAANSALGTANGTLNSANGHLANVDSGIASGNSTLSAINGKLGGTLQVGGTVTIGGTPAVTSGDRTQVLVEETRTVDANAFVDLIGDLNTQQTLDTSAYKTLTLYVQWCCQGTQSLQTLTVVNGDAYVVDVSDPAGSASIVKALEPAPPNVVVRWVNESGTAANVHLLLVGRGN